MTEQHRAKPETWAFIEECAPRYSFESCLLELHDRVEALETGLTTVSLELRDRVEALEAALRPTIPECNEDYWRRDALESLLHAATSYKLNVYGVEELQIYEDRARKVLACWDKKPLESNNPAGPDSSLMERVEKAMWAGTYTPDVRVAIREVATWLDQQKLHIAAKELRREVG